MLQALRSSHLLGCCSWPLLEDRDGMESQSRYMHKMCEDKGSGGCTYLGRVLLQCLRSRQPVWLSAKRTSQDELVSQEYF